MPANALSVLGDSMREVSAAIEEMRSDRIQWRPVSSVRSDGGVIFGPAKTALTS